VTGDFEKKKKIRLDGGLLIWEGKTPIGEVDNLDACALIGGCQPAPSSQAVLAIANCWTASRGVVS
jgi:hypothetical protein